MALKQILMAEETTQQEGGLHGMVDKGKAVGETAKKVGNKAKSFGTKVKESGTALKSIWVGSDTKEPKAETEAVEEEITKFPEADYRETNTSPVPDNPDTSFPPLTKSRPDDNEEKVEEWDA